MRNEIPLLMKGHLVNQVIDGNKTQTRRIIDPSLLNRKPGTVLFPEIEYPYRPGDLLWVRETYADAWNQYLYRANERYGKYSIAKWTPAIHMPKKACRLWLEVISVRPERIQSICREDCLAEGIETVPGGYKNYHSVFPEGFKWPTPFHSFQSLWESMPGGTECWKANGWVWRIEFKVVERRDYER